MLIQLFLSILLCCIVSCNAIKLTKIIFTGETIISHIMNNTDMEKNRLCNKLFNNIVKYDFICIYNSNIINKTNTTNTTENIFNSKLLYDTINIINETLFNKGDMLMLFYDNSKDFKYIYDRYKSFYKSIFAPIYNIVKNVIKYIITKMKIISTQIHTNIREYLKDKYTLNEEDEKIILKNLPNIMIRYFTNNTINKYNNCLEFLNSLETSFCLTTNIENIQEVINLIEQNINKID